MLVKIEKGTHLTVYHNPSGRLISYRVVEERETGLLRLLNLNSFYLMDGFKTKDSYNIIRYIERMKCRIVEISFV